MVSNILEHGAMFLDYRIERVLGEGGMCIVYKAIEAHSNDEVAIKLLRPGTARADFTERFNKECRFHAKLKHPNIVKMRCAGIAEGVPFIVLDFLNGKTLRALLTRYTRFNLVNALHIMIQIADAMQFAHSKKIWHHDLKPENIMVGVDEKGSRGHAWLLDFGIAKDTAGGLGTDDLPELGTARYMSPERVRCLHSLAKKAPQIKKPDGRADIYAFGVIFYEILTGRHTFIDEENPQTFQETMTGHLIAQPVPAHEIVFDCPEDVWPVVARCLAINPEERYQTFEEVSDALSALIRQSVPAAHPLFRFPGR
ncbi:MAG: serine/threonine-protein kinase [Byssovorax sp.]